VYRYLQYVVPFFQHFIELKPQSLDALRLHRCTPGRCRRFTNQKQVPAWSAWEQPCWRTYGWPQEEEEELHPELILACTGMSVVALEQCRSILGQLQFVSSYARLGEGMRSCLDTWTF
jgi:hypothetical protein